MFVRPLLNGAIAATAIASCLAASGAIGGCSLFATRATTWGPVAVDPTIRLALRTAMIGQPGTRLYIYGYAGIEDPANRQKGKAEFIGCITSPPALDDSIWNPDGRFGSLTLRRSVWNRFGPYGDPTSQYSPWNLEGIAPPILTDEYDHQFGYLTLNPLIAKRTQLAPIVRMLQVVTGLAGRERPIAPSPTPVGPRL